MNFQSALSIFEIMDVETEKITANSRLGSNIGMDSQEIVELHTLLEQRYSICIPSNELSRDLSIQDLIDMVQKLQQTENKQAQSESKQGFAFSCETKIEIERDVDTVFNRLYYVTEWPKVLPHVDRIDLLYGDKQYQEFIMTVQSDPGTLKVRSVRNCEPDKKQIRFFQPEPPKFLKHHAGGWKFIETQNGGCEVITYHNWNLNATIAAETFKKAENGYEKAIEKLMLEHAQYTLQNWKKILSA